MMNSRAKQEVDPSDTNKTLKTPSTSSRQWGGGFRNPRIVRVSRTFGGKDRHSKVCTVRGLRDRRIRLSVPTAIQLYDLQDRLGLNQPSKVVDWLLEATKAEIDKLPPLQIPPGNFMSQFFNNSASSNDNPEGISGYEAQIQAQNFFPTSNIQSSFPSYLKTSDLPYNTNNNYYHLELPNSNLSLSQFGNNSNFPNHGQEDHSHMNYINSSSSMAYLHPFPPYTAMETSSAHHDPRQINHFQFLSSSSSSQNHNVLPNPLNNMPTLHWISSPLKSLSLNVNDYPKILHSQETDNNERDKGGNGS